MQRTRAILFESFETHFARQGYSLGTIVTFLAREGFVVGKYDQRGGLVPLPAGYRSIHCENAGPQLSSVSSRVVCLAVQDCLSALLC